MNRLSVFKLLPVAIGVFLLQACGGGGHKNEQPTPVVPSISSFAAASPSITAGTSTTLTGVFSNGTGIVGNGVGAVASGVAISTGNLTATTTFILSVTSSTGNTVSSSVTVTVVDAPSISAFAPQKAIATVGIGTTLNSTFTGGTGSIDHDIGTVSSGSSTGVTPATTTTYTLTVTNSLGVTASATTSVTVVPLAHVTSFAATPAIIRAGNSSSLAAVFEDGSALVSGPGGAIGAITSGGSLATPVIAESTTFTLDVTNAAGDVTTVTTDVTVSPFSSTGSLVNGRTDHQMTLLPNGKVLVTGGAGDSSGGSGAPTVLMAELYDPATGEFSETGEIAAGRAQRSATLLTNGKVLVAGGTTAELFDPATETFSPTGSLQKSRIGQTGTLLLDGRVLVVGGAGVGVNFDRTAELYDPATGVFTLTPGLTVRNTSIFRHTATRLNSGKVLICGGYNGDVGASTTSQCELFDPTTDTFSATGSMTVSRIGAHAALLPDGRVVMAGGIRNFPDLSGPEIYDPVSATFTTAGVLPAENICTATTLPDGKVLFAGMRNVSTAHSRSPVIFDPTTFELTETGPMVTNRDSCDFATVVLQNGQTLIAGGHENDPPVDLSTAELFY